MKKRAKTYTISAVAEQFDLHPQTLRLYEREGLLKPADRTESGYRLYDKDSARRIHFIKQAQHCGFTLTEIRDLLVLRTRDAACCGDVRSRAIEKKLQLEHKIKAMKSMSKALDHLIADCANEARPVGECTILAALEQVTGRAH